MCECDLISYSEHTNTEPKTATRQDGFMKRFLSGKQPIAQRAIINQKGGTHGGNQGASPCDGQLSQKDYHKGGGD